MRVKNLALLSLLLTGCGDQQNGPEAKDLRDRFAVELPGYVAAKSFKVEATQNIGSEVEPVYKSRFKAEVELRTPTYSADGADPEALFVKALARAGETRTIYGVATSRLRAGAWNTDFQFENNPLPALGSPIDFFESNQIIIRGSPEEATFHEARRQQELERERARQTHIESLVGKSIAATAMVEGSSNPGYPITLMIASYDSSSGRVTGEVAWPTLRGAVKTFEGQFTGDNLVATETSWKVQPEVTNGILLGIVYTFTLDSNGRLSSGRWRHPSFSGGAITL